MRFNGLTKGFFILILLLVTWAFFDVLSPYFSAILWAAILAVIFYPVKNALRIRMGDRNGLAALLSVLLICLIVFIPLMVIFSSLAFELNIVYTRLQQNDTQFSTVVASLFAHLPHWLRTLMIEHDLDTAAQIQQKLSEAALRGGQYLAGSAFLIGKGTFGFAISFGVMVYLLFSAVLPAERWPLAGAPDPRQPAAVGFRQTASVCQVCRGRQSDGKRHGRGGPGPGFAGRDRLLDSRYQRQHFVGRADGVPVPHPGGGFGHHLGARGHLPLCHAATVAGPVYRRVLCADRGPGG